MESAIQNFISYLHNTKKTSGNTEVSYERDLKKMAHYFEEGISFNQETTLCGQSILNTIDKARALKSGDGIRIICASSGSPISAQSSAL